MCETQSKNLCYKIYNGELLDGSLDGLQYKLKLQIFQHLTITTDLAGTLEINERILPEERTTGKVC